MTPNTLQEKMPFPDVAKRGDDFFHQYPRDSQLWKMLHFTTSFVVIGISKIILKLFYNVRVNNFNTLKESLAKSKAEKRGLMTVMNHQSTIDDPFVWATFPMSLYKSLSNIRFCLGAHNICFKNKFVSNFFTLGGVLSTERFGRGPFQGSIDCGINVLSKNGKKDGYSSWMHVYPEAFVLQLKPPYNNSMRYFKWGVTRMILESSKPPIIVPIFATGFEQISSEDESLPTWKHFINSWGATVNVTVGEPVQDHIIESYRREWQILISKYSKPDDTDLTEELKFGKEAQDLRSRLAAELRSEVSEVRKLNKELQQEDPRFQDHKWWKVFTETEGKSDPDVRFVGQNWAIKRLHDFLNIKPKADNQENIDSIVTSNTTTTTTTTNDNDMKKKKNN